MARTPYAARADCKSGFVDHSDRSDIPASKKPTFHPGSHYRPAATQGAGLARMRHNPKPATCHVKQIMTGPMDNPFSLACLPGYCHITDATAIGGGGRLARPCRRRADEELRGAAPGRRDSLTPVRTHRLRRD